MTRNPATRYSAPRRPRSRIAREEHGAVALIALFMATFLTAMLAYLVGIGETVLYRERMQDGADAAALSAAVLHARGMNLIALVNMAMAALLAVLVALKLIETVIAIALIVIAISSFFAPGLATAIPPLSQLRTQVRTAHDELRPPIHATLEALHAAGRALREVVPLASVVRAEQIAMQQPKSPVEHALAVPARPSLPTVDGTFDELCAKAGDYVGATVHLALDGIVPEEIACGVSGAIEDLAHARADWFCGADGAEPPSTEYTHTLRHPIMPSRERCERISPAAQDYDAGDHRALCEQAEADEQAATPDPHTGKCTEGCDPDLYAQRSGLARRACAPREQGDGLQKFSWQERRFHREYTWTRGAWAVTSAPQWEEAGADYRLRTEDARPCGGRAAPIAPEWNLAPRDADGRPLPVCTNAAPPEGPGRDGMTRREEHVDVTHVFGCEEQVRRRYDLDPQHRGDRVAAPDGSSSASMVPQAMEPDVELGEDAFQVRAIALGSAPPGSSRRIMEVATWGKSSSADGSWLTVTAPLLGRVAIAQAEYYYAVERRDAPERASYLWNMRWQARLRRFRAPKDDGATGTGAVPAVDELLSTPCSGAFGRDGGRACRGLRSILDLLVH